MPVSPELRNAIEQVLRQTQNYVSAYQILERLPAAMRDQLVVERGIAGQGNGSRYTSVSLVSQAAQMLCSGTGPCEFIYIDSGNLRFEVAGDLIPAGNKVCACYRVR